MWVDNDVRRSRGGWGFGGAPAMACGIVAFLVVACAVVFAAADPAGDKAVLEEFKAGITNSDTLGWTDPNPCLWNSRNVKCDAAGNVQQLRVRALGLTGTVTSTLNKLSQLTILELNLNSFTGPMPSLAGLAHLQVAYLDDNNFSSIPADCFDGLTSINELHVENNPNLGGWSLPQSLSLATSMTVLSVTNSTVTGQLPSFLGTLPSLITLEASYNSLQGGIPDSFAASNIQTLKLNNQQMNGTIAAVGGMVGIQTLWLQVNNLYGPVPTGLENAAGLRSLRINDNNLVGRLPLGIATRPALEEAVMNNNKLTGELPSFPASVLVTNYDATTFCAAAGKQCAGKVDSLLDFLAAAGYPQQVAVTWIGSNPCNGWIGVACDPSSGEIVSIVLISYGLTGTISPSLGNLTSLTTLVLSKNALTGPVPDVLITLPSLKTVDVSYNNLTGPLPLFPASVKFTYVGNPLLMPGSITPAPGSAPAPPVVDTPVGSPPSSPNAPTSPDGTPVGAPTNGTGSGYTSKKSVGIGAILGGALGGLAVAVSAAVLVVCLYKKKRKKLQGGNGMSIHPRGDSGSDSELMKVMVDHSYSSASHQATVGSYGDSLHSGSSSNDHQVIFGKDFW